jgi:hypothetical protein
MIQRLQTVFLFLAIVLLGLFLWFPVIIIDSPTIKYSLQGWELYQSLRFMEQPYLYYFNAIFVGTAIGFSLLAIFLFKKRGIQMLLCWFSILFILSAEAFAYYKYQTLVFDGDVIFPAWNLLPFGAVLFELLAFVYIRKDENLLKSVDRLRD